MANQSDCHTLPPIINDTDLTNSAMTNKLPGYIALSLTVLFWSSSYIGIKIGLSGYTPVAMGFFRYLIASLVMVPIFVALPNKKCPTFAELCLLLVNGAIGIGLYNVMLNIAELHVIAAVSGFVISTVPVFATIIAVLFLGERVYRLGWIGMSIAIVGLIIIFIAKAGTHFQINHSILYLCVSAFSAALYITLQKPLLKKFQPLEIASYAIWAGTLVTIGWASKAWHEIPTAPLNSTLAVIYLGVFPGAISYTGWSITVKYMPVSQATAGLYAAPTLTTLLGWLILNEMPLPLTLLGGLCALFGAWVIYWSTLRIRKRAIHG